MEAVAQQTGGAIILSTHYSGASTHPHASQIARRNEGVRILLVQRGAQAPTCPSEWGMPAGIVEDETASEAAAREVMEETHLGFATQTDTPFWSGMWVKPKGGSQRNLNYYVGKWFFLHERSGVILSSECCGVGWFTYEEAIRLPLSFRYREVLDALRQAGLL